MIQAVDMTLKPQKGAWQIPGGRLSLLWSKYQALYPIHCSGIGFGNKGLGESENLFRHPSFTQCLMQLKGISVTQMPQKGI